MSKRSRKPVSRPSAADGEQEVAAPPRIVGGSLRGRKLEYLGDRCTRPMKERVREAVFNLVGPAVKGLYAIDLFAGTGALGLEAISRGAAEALFIERHFPTADAIRRNALHLGVGDRCTVATADTFFYWSHQADHPPATAWLVFCSPPYALYVEQAERMQGLIRTVCEKSPAGSIIVVETDARFDTDLLPESDAWDVRAYPPAVVALYRKPAEADPAGG